jgi:hypothetical protein
MNRTTFLLSDDIDTQHMVFDVTNVSGKSNMFFSILMVRRDVE